MSGVIGLNRSHGRAPPPVARGGETLWLIFKVTLGRADLVERTAFVREPRKLPVVLSPEEVARLLDAAPGAEVQSSAERGLRGGIARLRSGGAEAR